MGGFSLLEVLISLLVLSIGLLGLAALQAASIRSNESAYVRSQVQLVGSEIIDRIRADRDNATTYNTGGFEDDFGNTHPWLDDQLARLPGSTELNVDCGGTPLMCAVSARWNDARAETDAQAAVKTFTLRARP